MDLNEFKVIKEVEKKTYPQKWEAYNKAKTREKTIAMSLLLELLQLFEDKRPISPGRPCLPLSERVLCMFIYSYSRFSSRRAISDLNLVKNSRMISKVPHFNTILNMFKELSMTRVLSELIEITSLPLRQFEEHFAIDSTGFSCAVYVPWLNIRTQKATKKREWKKAHVISGARTNIITGVSITEANRNDSPELIPLIKKTARHFDMKEVSADKAYISRNNLQAIAQIGAIPYIPFKKNNRQNPRGFKIWSTMYSYFYQNQAEFMRHYHLRSNAETAFSMIKKNFGHRLRTKNFTSQINEILMKCLCHNLSVLVQESFELGINIDFNKCASDYFAQKQN